MHCLWRISHHFSMMKIKYLFHLQAFEWSNLSSCFYSFFLLLWNYVRKTWTNLRTTRRDADFSSFLKSGWSPMISHWNTPEVRCDTLIRTTSLSDEAQHWNAIQRESLIKISVEGILYEWNKGQSNLYKQYFSWYTNSISKMVNLELWKIHIFC